MRKILFCLVLSFSMSCPALSQSHQQPLTRAEIFGLLASGSSYSYVAHLVKIRGVNFSPDSNFLALVDLAGGRGILHDRLFRADPVDLPGAPIVPSDPPFQHLAKCAEFRHVGAMDKAVTECRAAILDDPESPWPLLATAACLPGAVVAEPQKEQLELAQRAVSLAPGSAEAHNVLAHAYGYGPEVYSELQKARNLNPEELDVLPQLAHMLPNGSVIGGKPVSPDNNQDPELQKLLSVEPDLASAHVQLALSYISLGAREKSLAEFQEALRIEPDNSQIHFWLANTYRDWNNNELSLAELREAVRISPEISYYRESLAFALKAERRFAEVLDEYRDFASRAPTNSFANAHLVDELVEQKDFDSAIAEMRRYLAATSEGMEEAKHVASHRNDYERLAELLRDNRDLEGAAFEYDRIIRFVPDDSYIRNEYGNLLYDQEKIAEAVEQYKGAIQAAPEIAAYHHNLGNCIARLDDLDGAIAEYRLALGLNPHEPHTRLRLARALSRKKQTGQALAELKSAVTEYPDDASVHADLGYFLEADNASSAAAEFRRALELDPILPYVHNDLAWILATDAKLRNPQQALDHAEQAVELLAADPETTPADRAAFLDTLAEALLASRRPSDALAIEREAFAADPQNPRLPGRLKHFEEAARSQPTKSTD